MAGKLHVGFGRALTSAPDPAPPPAARLHVGSAVARTAPAAPTPVRVNVASVALDLAAAPLRVKVANVALKTGQSAGGPLLVHRDGSWRPLQVYVRRAGSWQAVG